MHVTDVTAAGTIVGTVQFQGKAPERKKIAITRNKKVCGKETKFAESMVVGSNGGVKNAVLYLTDIKKGKKFDASARFQIDQRGCQFHVIAIFLRSGASPWRSAELRVLFISSLCSSF